MAGIRRGFAAVGLPPTGLPATGLPATGFPTPGSPATRPAAPFSPGASATDVRNFRRLNSIFHGSAASAAVGIEMVPATLGPPTPIRQPASLAARSTATSRNDNPR